MPFFVHTNGITVRVLGTVFNVKAYGADAKIETTLLEGKIQVELAGDSEKKIILTPHEKLTVNKTLTAKQAKAIGNEVSPIKYEVAALPETGESVYPENAWIENKIMFANTSFDEVALAMERKYNVHIIFKDEALKKEQISGVLENESLPKALGLLKQITLLQAKMVNDTVYLGRK